LLVHALTLAEVLVGGVRIGKGVDMRADLQAAGIRLADRDDDESLHLAELRVTTGLKLPDCCVLDTAVTNETRWPPSAVPWRPPPVGSVSVWSPDRLLAPADVERPQPR
jgi:hypothetical protein